MSESEKKKITFVLGAGASFHLGFPLGTKHLEEIVSKIESDSTWRKILDELEIGSELRRSFNGNLIRSQVSVDRFLEKNQNFLKIGKYAIAMCLIPYEIEDRLYDFSLRDNNWYNYIFGKMQTCEISFITFNYDRSLEHFFYISYKHWVGLSHDIIDQVLNIPIIHIHGKLGKLDWDSENGNAYDGILTIEKVMKASERIIITSESSENSSVRTEARKKLFASDEIHFLGFGYDDKNLSKLSIKQVQEKENIQIYGTAYGLEAAQRKDIESKWKIKTDQNNKEVLPYLKSNVQFEKDYNMQK